MKLRVKHNSVRVRVNKMEVRQLFSQHSLQERIEFNGDGTSALVYALCLDDSSPCMSVSFQSGSILVTLPWNEARLWAANPDEVGLYLQKDIGNGKTVGIIVEKDFQCIDGPPEDIDPEAYPNPLMTGCSVAG